MSIAEENVTELVVVRGSIGAGSGTAVKDDTGVGTRGVRVHAREIVIGKSETNQIKGASTGCPRVFEGICRNSGEVSSRFLRGGRTDIHLHVSQNAVENQRLKPLSRFRCNITCCAIGCSTKRQDDVIREVGVKLESETDLLLIGRAGDSAGFFTGRVQRGKEHAGEDCDNRNYHTDCAIFIISVNELFDNFFELKRHGSRR